MASFIYSKFPKHETYVELFGGAGSVLLRKPKSPKEVYSEINPVIAGFMLTIRDEGGAVSECVDETIFQKASWEYALKPDENDEIDQARCLIVRSFMSRGADALWKTNTGFREHAISRAAWNTMPAGILAASERLREVEIHNWDWEKTFAYYDKGSTLFYIDPPYIEETLKGSHRYPFSMKIGEHENLLRTLTRSHLGRSAVSHYSHPLYEEALKSWHRYEYKAMADFQQKGANRNEKTKMRTEVLWVKP